MNPDRVQAVLDQKVRYFVYDQAIKTGWIPSVADIASALSLPVPEIQNSVKRLADAHILVLQNDSPEILMANPFSAVPTPFLVQTNERSYFGNCIWDALGIPAMLAQDAMIKASCADCGTAVTLEIKSGALLPATGLAHFALPASRWWADVVFT